MYIDGCIDGCFVLSSLAPRWESFEQSRDAFSTWLAEAESKLPRDPEPQASLLDMEQLSARYQVLHHDVIARQTNMDDVTQKGQELLETNSDAKVSHTITQLTTKYQSLDSASKVPVHRIRVQTKVHGLLAYDIRKHICRIFENTQQQAIQCMFWRQELVKRVESVCADLRRQQTSQDELTSWLQQQRQALDGVSADVSKDATEAALMTVRVSQTVDFRFFFRF